jgi:membrane protease YdiL (CAAX protease family)
MYLLVVGAASLGLTTTTNHAAAVFLRQAEPSLLWLADATVPLLLISMVLYFAIRPLRPLAAPAADTRWSPILRLSFIWIAVWLASSWLNACIRGGWFAYTHGAASVAGFVVIAPLAEEVLFRGTLYELAERSFGEVSPAAIWLTSACFSLQHFQLHGYRADRSALIQVAFTFPMGLVFAVLRRRSQSIWPGFVLHVLTNLPGAFGE